MKKSLEIELRREDDKTWYRIKFPVTQEEFSEIMTGENLNDYKIGQIEYTSEFDNGFHCNLGNKYGWIGDLNKINAIAYYLSSLKNPGTLQAMLSDESAIFSMNLNDWIENAEEIQNFDYFELPCPHDSDEENDRAIVNWYCNRVGVDISNDFLESCIDYQKMASDIVVNGVCDCFLTDRAFIYRVENQTEAEPLDIPENLKLV